MFTPMSVKIILTLGLKFDKFSQANFMKQCFSQIWALFSILVSFLKTIIKEFLK